MSKLHILLLAAGASSRMGSPKQLLEWGGKTLLEHQVDTLNNLGHPVSVVLGSHADSITQRTSINATILNNHDWHNGIGTSIALGVQTLIRNFPEIEGFMVTLVDQPLLEEQDYRNLIDSFQPGKKMIVVSSSSEGIWSVPVLFDASYLEELQSLDGDKGAMGIIRSHNEKVKLVNCSKLEDIDDTEDYQRLLARFNHRS